MRRLGLTLAAVFVLGGIAGQAFLARSAWAQGIAPNFGDLSLGTSTNGLSLVGQVLSLAAAGSSSAGAVTTGTQTFAGAKTFSSALNVGYVASSTPTTAGAWLADSCGIVWVTNTPYGSFSATDTTNVKFGAVTCNELTTSSATGTGTIEIHDETADSTLCSHAGWDCSTVTAAGSVTVAITNCNQTPVAGHIYSVRISSACSVGNPKMSCSVEVLR